MADELISKQQVCEVLAHFAPENYTQLVEMLVVKLPAVDAVEVVRCKDCKWYEELRMLKPDGVLVFKWSEYDIPADKVWKAIGQKPLFGHHSGKNSKTFWGCFMKLADTPELLKGGDGDG